MDKNNLKKHFFKRVVSDYKKEENNNNENNELSFLYYIGRRIRIIRKSQNRTISYIADMAKKYLQSICKELKLEREIYITNLNKIAKVLNIPISFLVSSYKNQENNEKLLSIVMKLKDYSVEELENIDNIINDIKKIEE